MIQPVTVIIGAYGQDGRILTEALKRLGHKLILIGRGDLDILCIAEIESLVSQRPDYIYYLAAYHHQRDEALPEPYTLIKNSNEINFVGFLNFLESIRKISPRTKIFYASSCHIFNGSTEKLSELSPVNPQTPYALSKYHAQEMAKYYREQFGILASVGILFNHESRFRRAFLSHKIVSTAHSIKKGASTTLDIGDLDSVVDWGSAHDYVEAMIAIMNHDVADTYVIATGEGHRVEDFVQIVFNLLNMDFSKYVRVNPELLLTPHQIRIGDPSKLFNACGWKPKLSFHQLVESLVID